MPDLRAPVPWLSVLITILTTAGYLAEEARRYELAMPGMTLPFKVRDEAPLKGMAPGDLRTAHGWRQRGLAGNPRVHLRPLPIA